MATFEPVPPQLWKRSMAQDRIKQEWTGIGDKLQRRWRRLTPDDVLFAGGSAPHKALLQVHEFESEF